jgi:hypothetical protein
MVQTIRHKITVIYFLVTALVACNETGEAPPMNFPLLKIIDESGANLLNPENESSYDSSYITGYFIWNDLPTEKLELRVSNERNYKDLINYYLYLDLDYRVYSPIVGTNTLVIKLSEFDTDTLSWIVNEKNGQFILKT